MMISRGLRCVKIHVVDRVILGPAGFNYVLGRFLLLLTTKTIVIVIIIIMLIGGLDCVFRSKDYVDG